MGVIRRVGGHWVVPVAAVTVMSCTLLLSGGARAASPEGWTWELDPSDQPYPAYLADPRRPRTQGALGVIDSNIADTSEGRILLDVGTRYTLFKATDPDGNEWSFDIEGGLFTQFDSGHQLDVVGWDGVVGVFGAYQWQDILDVRVGYKHLSGHLGDELIENAGRKRIGYNRDALAVGVAWAVDSRWTLYVEPSWAFALGNEQLQQRKAVEGGFRYQGPFDAWQGIAALYGGVHLRAFEETDWEPGVSAQLGYLIKRDDSSSNVRLALEFYSGRAILHEFALDSDDTYLNLAVTFEFY